jgi:hypothetical protein
MTSKSIMGIIATVVLIGGGIWVFSNRQTTTPPQDSTGRMAPVSQSIGTTTTGFSLISTSNTDAALTQDMVTVDTEMAGIDADTASVDKGLSNQN